MISQLKGVLVEKQAPAIVLDIQGVGYEVLVPMSSFISLPNIGEALAIYTQMIVREDSQTLYGFNAKQERQLFQTLLKVNGVGAKMALGILSAMDADAFVHCVREKDISTLVKLPGVGKKTAERLIIEMVDRVKDWQLSSGHQSSQAQNVAPNVEEEALAALQSLGYRAAEAQKTINAAMKQEPHENSESLIRAALRMSAR